MLDAAGLPGENARFGDRLLGWRDRILASAAFQRWASGFPLTAPIAHRRARALFDLCAGFVYAQILFACVKLRLFDHLSRGPLALADLAQRLGLPDDAAERLLRAAVALRLVSRRRGGRYGLGALGAALAGNPGVAAMIEHHAMLYDDLRDPVALLRGEGARTALGRFWPYARAEGAGDTAPYSALMDASQAMIAGDVLDAYDVARHRHLLDIGGGEGRFALEASRRAPALAVSLFDLPDVAARARVRLEGRVATFGGDFRRDALPEGADLMSFVRVIHDHDDQAALRLLQAAHRALPPRGTVLVAEPMAETRGAERMGDAYFGFYLLAMGSGRPRPPDEIKQLLRSAGFERIRMRKTRRPMLVRVITARKPA